MPHRRRLGLLICLLACGQCTQHESYPPAVPEERQMLGADAIPATFQPSGEERVPLSDVTGVSIRAEALMTESPSPVRPYKDLKKLERQRPRIPLPPTDFLQPIAYTPRSLGTPPLGRSTLQDASSPVPPSPPTRGTKADPREDPATLLAEANALSLVKPRSQWMRGGIVTYPFEQGRTYLFITSQDNPGTIFLPPGQRMSAPLMLNSKEIECKYPDPDFKPYREAIVCMSNTEDATATTPLFMRSGIKIWIKFQTAPALSTRGITWSVSREAYELLQADEEVPRDGRQEVSTAPGIPPIDGSRIHDNYKIEVVSGTPPWVPAHIFDDGTRTHILFRESLRFGNAPAVFSLHSDGTEGVIDWMAYDHPQQPDAPSRYVIPHIWPALVLKGGDKMVVKITRGPTRRTLAAPLNTEGRP
jgi:type IV secretory pathway VirB9-like protein